MFAAGRLDSLSTWIVTPKLELEANPLVWRAGFVRMAPLILLLLYLPFPTLSHIRHTKVCDTGASAWHWRPESRMPQRVVCTDWLAE